MYQIVVYGALLLEGLSQVASQTFVVGHAARRIGLRVAGWSWGRIFRHGGFRFELGADGRW